MKQKELFSMINNIPEMRKIVPVLLAVSLSFGCVSKEKNTHFEIDDNPAALAEKGDGKWWKERHQTILSRLSQNPDVILIGNSILHSLDIEDRKEVWGKYLDQYKTVNMGISGDRTENVIWRLQNGSLENIKSKSGGHSNWYK